MNVTLKIVLILFGLAYLISPVDLIPDLILPWVGWIDDSLVLWSVYYLIRYGELPWFLFKKKAGGGGGFPGSTTKPGQKSSKQKKKTKANSERPPNRAAPNNSAPNNANTAKPHKQARKKTSPTAAIKTPHEIIGVPSDASWTHIQAAYKEKIKQYHPDKLSHLGEEFSTLANEKFLEIQTAYDELKQKNT